MHDHLMSPQARQEDKNNMGKRILFREREMFSSLE